MENYITSHQITYGKNITPNKRIELFSPSEWEELIEEWLELKKGEYIEIERLGGSGDKGRDVVAYVSKDISNPPFVWDCYQCKHYDRPLMPIDVYVEFGKIIYYSYLAEYSIPRNYYLVSPKGYGTKLTTLLEKPVELKRNLIASWNNNCKDKISNTTKIELKGEFLKYVDNFDFKIFKRTLVKDIITEHKKHSNHLIRFGGNLPERLRFNKADMPDSLQQNENRYVSQLLSAYESASGKRYEFTNDLDNNRNYKKHFIKARISFHHAEQLRNFYRDALPVHVFEDFQDEICTGVINVAENDFDNGFARVRAVEQEANKINISSNPFKDVCLVHDKIGICHQLSNDGKLTWCDDE